MKPSQEKPADHLDPLAILQDMRMAPHAVIKIRSKDNIDLYRIYVDGGTAILKVFNRAEDRRELTMYTLFEQLDIPTLRVLALSGQAILLEDLAGRSDWRLGTEVDCDDPQIAQALAVWYKILHDRGRAYVKTAQLSLYDEADLLTPDSLAVVCHRTNTGTNPIWPLLENSLPALLYREHHLPRTFAYHDFHFSNLAVSIRGSRALMFDYNRTGQGYVYADVQNVLYLLSDRAKQSFLDTYGELDPGEAVIYNICAHLETLVAAAAREVWPHFAGDSLARLQDGRLLTALKHALATD